jgi:hypothetical protein
VTRNAESALIVLVLVLAALLVAGTCRVRVGPPDTCPTPDSTSARGARVDQRTTYHTPGTPTPDGKRSSYTAG